MVNDTSSVTATASAWDSLYHTNTLESATIVKLDSYLSYYPYYSLPLYWQSRQQDNNQGVKLKKSSPVFILYFILASLLTTVPFLVLAIASFHLSNSSPNSSSSWLWVLLVSKLTSLLWSNPVENPFFLEPFAGLLSSWLVLACNYSSVFSKKKGSLKATSERRQTSFLAFVFCMFKDILSYHLLFHPKIWFKAK